MTSKPFFMRRFLYCNQLFYNVLYKDKKLYCQTVLQDLQTSKKIGWKVFIFNDKNNKQDERQTENNLNFKGIQSKKHLVELEIMMCNIVNVSC